MTRYDTDQLIGVMNVIKGKMFERLVELHENADGDEWGADLHEDESYPGSDIVFTNLVTGDTIEVFLKAVDDLSIIETALRRYPDIPILTTSEMEGPFEGMERISTTDISNDELSANADELFDELMKITSATAAEAETMLGVGAGTGAAGFIQLWPFVAAYSRGRISKDALEMAFKSVLGDQGVALAGRVAMAALFGPIYAWYLLAKGIVGITTSDSSESDEQLMVRKTLVYRPAMAFTI